MKCYYHPEVDAVGICKNCQKGLCRDCAVDVGNGIACKTSKDNCVDQVTTINSLIQRNRVVSQHARGTYAVTSLLYAGVGVFMFLMGISFGELSPLGGVVGMVVGALFVCYGIYIYVIRSKILRSRTDDT